MKNMISWFEIPANDIKRAKKFYEGLMEVEMQDMDMGDGVLMSLFPGEENSVTGAIVQFADFYKTGHDGTLIYLNCEPDLQSFEDRVEKLGGKVLMPKKQISEEHGYMGLIEDCEGNRVALYSRS